MDGRCEDNNAHILFRLVSNVDVLRCISDMDRLQLIGEVERASESQATAERRTTSFFTSFIGAPETPVSPIAAEMRLRRPSIGKLANELNSQSMILMIDRIFANSAKLDGSSIVVFMRCLCGTAEEEVAEGRTFMLHKLIESTGGVGSWIHNFMITFPRSSVAYYNMGRIRLEWTQIWHVLAAFFNNVGCHQDVTIANDAVDSLRQLSMKFLERAELAHFDTHSEFLKPLEHIMRHTPHIVIRDLIIQSMEQMIAARAESMHSGYDRWRMLDSPSTVIRLQLSP